jgi:hypothetical protein
VGGFLPELRQAAYVRAVGFHVFGKGVELHLERGDPLELNTLLVSQLNQESFQQQEALRDGLHNGGYDGGNSSTSGRVRFRHVAALYSQRRAASVPF